MKQNAVIILFIIFSLVCEVSYGAVYNWTGAEDNNVFNELNWELDGSPGTNIPKIDHSTAVNSHEGSSFNGT